MPAAPAAQVAVQPPPRGKSAPGVIRTALCVEPRQGRVHVFMPPVESTEDYIDLIAAIERTAAQLKMPVIIEGTPPEHDPRLNHLKVTPDPGVIEVNMHPAHGWPEIVEQTSTLYDEARQTRLGTEKFLLDGRHTGTGGGNHMVLGGATPADSPFLRRPDLLRSLLGYWHNHPSLSFLFSGLFFGPTSQHPRVDEGRNDSLHELEIAFTQVPPANDAPPATMRRRAATPRRGWSIACFGICWPTSPATRIAPSSASTSSTRPRRAAAARGSWSCARSRCRRTRR